MTEQKTGQCPICHGEAIVMQTSGRPPGPVVPGPEPILICPRCGGSGLLAVPDAMAQN
jgi:hypothetical protein